MAILQRRPSPLPTSSSLPSSPTPLPSPSSTATTATTIHSRHCHRQEKKQPQQQQQKHIEEKPKQEKQFSDAVDISRARITDAQSRPSQQQHQQQEQPQQQQQQQTNLKQRKKFVINVETEEEQKIEKEKSVEFKDFKNSSPRRKQHENQQENQQRHQQSYQHPNLENSCEKYATATTRSIGGATFEAPLTTSQIYKQQKQNQQHPHQQQQQQRLRQHQHHNQRTEIRSSSSIESTSVRKISHPCSWSSFIESALERSTRQSNCRWHLDSTLCMMIMLFVIATVVISGHSVLAAQRDTFKVKDSKSVGSNANAIQNGLGGNGGNGGNGNVVDGASGDDANAISNGSADVSSNNMANGTNATVSQSSTSLNQTTVYNATISAAPTATTTTATITSIAGMTSKMSTTHSGSGSGSSSSGNSNSGGNSIASGSLQKGIGIGNSGINRNTIEAFEDMRNGGPYFDKAASKNVTALLGKTAYLNCRVKNLGNKTMLLQVSWVRHRDIHLLTVGRYTYTSDQRFRAIHQPQTEDWILQIKYPQHRDSGIYECQVSTTPHMSHYIHLNVVEPSTEIIGAPDLYIESGSTINLTCVILNSPEPPAYIFWNHNNAIINYDSPRGGVSVVTNKGETTTSFLLIKSARPSDSGLYQCNPSNAKPKSVTVHVLNGEFPAAMQRAGQAHHRMSQSHYLLLYLSMYFFTLAYVGQFMKLSSPQDGNLAEEEVPSVAASPSPQQQQQQELQAFQIYSTHTKIIGNIEEIEKSLKLTMQHYY